MWRREAAAAPIRPLAWRKKREILGEGLGTRERKKKERKEERGVPSVDEQLMNLTRIHGDVVLIPGLTQWVKDLALL